MRKKFKSFFKLLNKREEIKNFVMEAAEHLNNSCCKPLGPYISTCKSSLQRIIGLAPGLSLHYMFNTGPQLRLFLHVLFAPSVVEMVQLWAYRSGTFKYSSRSSKEWILGRPSHNHGSGPGQLAVGLVHQMRNAGSCPMLMISRWLTYTFIKRVGSVGLPWCGVVLALPNVAAGGGSRTALPLLGPQGQLSHLPSHHKTDVLFCFLIVPLYLYGYFPVSLQEKFCFVS